MRKRLKLFFGMLIILAFVIWIAVFNSGTADTNNNLKIYFLDVGQGDSIYIKTPDKKDILIDGGPDDKVLTELGKVMDFSDRYIDLVVLTHPHADHLTGLIEVINRYEVGEVWETGVEYSSATYDEWKNQIKAQNINKELVSFGKEKTFFDEKIKFLVLYPLSVLENKTVYNVNNASIVNELKFNKVFSLFLADAEKDAQVNFLDKISKVDILKVGHHGSENGLLEDLLKVARPAIAVISVGEKNKFNHPSSKIINLLKLYAARICRTDQNGTVSIFTDGNSYSVQTIR